MKRKFGFTLAEVLITLAIIGVVASMTLPALNTNIGAARNRAALKKTLATLNNAVRMNEANNGWNFSVGAGTEDGQCDRNDRAEDSTSLCGMFNDSLVGETFIGFVSSGTPTNEDWKVVDDMNITHGAPNRLLNYRLSDGTVIGLNGSVSSCTEESWNAVREANSGACTGYIDTNGVAGPNSVITCANGDDPTYIWTDPNATCEVERNTSADIFPIVFFDSTVQLASDAAIAYFNVR